MSTCHFLEPTLRDILRVVNPLEEDWTIRFQIIKDLQAVIQSIESLRGYTCSLLLIFSTCFYSPLKYDF